MYETSNMLKNETATARVGNCTKSFIANPLFPQHNACLK